MTAVESRPAGVVLTPSPGGHRPFGARVKAFVALTKPRIIELLLITTVPVMFLAAQGVPDLWLVLDHLHRRLPLRGRRQRAQHVHRPRHRRADGPHLAAPAGHRHGLARARAWSSASPSRSSPPLWFGLLVNWLSAALSLGALLFYVVVYTMLLKRRTAQNIVWGGIAGCMPVLIGWSAVTNSMSWAAVILFLVIFFWTPPHYWPLSMKVKDDYARVGVPMLPVVASNRVVARQIVLYSWVMVAVSLLLTPLGYTGWFYTAVALVTGGWWLWEAHALQNRAKAGRDGRASSRRCGSSTGPSPMCRCSSSRSRWTPSCAEPLPASPIRRARGPRHVAGPSPVRSTRR